MAFLMAQMVKNLPSAGDQGSVPTSRRSLGEANGYPLHFSCLENSKNTGAWQSTIHGVIKNQRRPSN